MKTTPPLPSERGSALIGFLLIAVLISFAIASVSLYVSQSSKLTHRRDDWNTAFHYAEGVCAVAISDINQAFTNTANPTWSFRKKLKDGTSKQKWDTTNGSLLVLTYTNSTAFSNVPVQVQLIMPNDPTPTSIKVVASATVNGVTQTNVAELEMSFGFAAAILCDHPGTSGTGTDKGTAQTGNVCIPGPPDSGQTIIDGGILANGRVNYPTNDLDITLAASTVSMTNQSTANQVPDYTLEGGTDQLFDFRRFTNAAAALGVGTNYFTCISNFLSANNKAATGAVGYLEGIIAVAVSNTDYYIANKITTNAAPKGIRIRGTLCFVFATNVASSAKVFNEADLYINPATMPSFVATNPATYKSGYPPTYSNTNKNPAGPITSAYLTARGFQPFSPEDDLPAVMYNNSIFDIHGDVNTSGVIYTPSFMEIENKKDNQIQYFRGMLISGNGIYVEEPSNNSTNIVSYDYGCLDRLATSGTKGKVLQVTRRY